MSIDLILFFVISVVMSVSSASVFFFLLRF